MATDIAIPDAQVPAALQKLAPEFQFLYPGKPAQFNAWLQSAALCVIENKDLRAALTTDRGKQTFVRAMQRAVSTGLSLNPQDAEAALVVIQDEISYWPMKEGLIRAAYDTGKVELISADTVYEKDAFKLKKTAHGDDYDFEPALGDRGKPMGYFALLVLVSGRSIVEYQSLAQIEAWKLKYGKGLQKQGSAWNTNFNGMAEKTVIKAILKGNKLGRAMDKLLDLDDKADTVPEPGSPEDRTPGTSADEVADALDAAEPVDTPPATVTIGETPHDLF
jgi:recombination protein RecT